MRILQINASYSIGSTGAIVRDLGDVISQNRDECFVLCGYSKVQTPNIFCMNKVGNTDYAVKKNIIYSRISGKMGYRYIRKTKKAIAWIRSIKPDVIHLHNIHGDWINIFILFSFLQQTSLPIIWTLHDCWAFTGRCAYFENIWCMKWKTGCYECKNMKTYPITYFFDFSRKMWKDKRENFSRFHSMRIVTPSQWLANYTRESFLSMYQIDVINNGIDIDIFSSSKNVAIDKLKVDNKKIVLAVASTWSERKGLRDLIILHDLLGHEEFQVIIIGLNASQLRNLPSSIIGMRRTSSIEVLVSYYSAASVLVNPTYQDNFPTVNLEALSCGTPVITYCTGGSLESVDESVGEIVEQGNVNELSESVKRVCKKGKDFYSIHCRNRAVEMYNKRDKFHEYIKLYYELAIKK